MFGAPGWCGSTSVVWEHLGWCGSTLGGRVGQIIHIQHSAFTPCDWHRVLVPKWCYWSGLKMAYFCQTGRGAL